MCGLCACINVSKNMSINTYFPFFFPRLDLSLALTVHRLKEIFLDNKDLFLREKPVFQVQFMFI